MQTNSANLLYWIATNYLDCLGPVFFKQWLDQFGNLETLFNKKKEELDSIGLSSKQIESIQKINWAHVEKDLYWCENNNCELITLQDTRYPYLLKEIANPPLVLYVQGEVNLLSNTQLAIVGSRNPTVSGRELSHYFASYLSKAGLTITSGLALGIDAAAHEGALSVDAKTIAVLGTGLQNIYPASNKKLAEQIKERGALVTEFSPQTPPLATNFPLRNRVISGLSVGVLVIEAALRSGSLITARNAGEQGRNVFAIPGSIHNPMARGCHQLLKQGAKLVETVNDILEELGSMVTLSEEHKSQKKVSDHQKKAFLQQIGYEITSLDAIIHRSGLTANEVSSMLLSLELDGYIKMVEGGYILN